MTYKWFGAMMVVLGCSGVGFSLAAGYRRKEHFLQQMIQALQYMEHDLQYRLTPLPALCHQAGRETGNLLGTMLENVAQMLDAQTAPDVYSCFHIVTENTLNLPENVSLLLLKLGQSLGRFDLPGQLEGLQNMRLECEEQLRCHCNNREQNLRNYKTLGICAGAALAILLA